EARQSASATPGRPGARNLHVGHKGTADLDLLRLSEFRQDIPIGAFQQLEAKHLVLIGQLFVHPLGGADRACGQGEQCAKNGDAANATKTVLHCRTPSWRVISIAVKHDDLLVMTGQKLLSFYYTVYNSRLPTRFLQTEQIGERIFRLYSIR